MGRHYLQIRNRLPAVLRPDWTVVELPELARHGAAHLANDELSFSSSFSDSAVAGSEPVSLVVAGGVLQYTDSPPIWFDRLVQLRSPFLLLDRMPLISSTRDRLTVQVAPPAIYEASYPAWFLAESAWLARFDKDHRVLLRWPANEDTVKLDAQRIVDQGALLQRR